MSWKWVLRGVKSRENFSRLTPEVVEQTNSDALTAKEMDAAELRAFYGVKLLQIEAGSLCSFRGAEDMSELRPLIDFNDLQGDFPEIVEYLQSKLSFRTPTVVQRFAIPLGLARKSFVAIAPTGSGKTFGFLVPMIKRLKDLAGSVDSNVLKSKCHSLILSPTRELAVQTTRILRDTLDALSLGELSVMDTSELAHTSDESASILVCTPGMRHILVERPGILEHCEIIIFDEVDELLNKSFIMSCDKIMKRILKKQKGHIQIMMFSASIKSSGEVVELIAHILPRGAPVIRVGTSTMCLSSQVNVELVNTGNELGKLSALKQLVEDRKLIPPCLIFVQDKDRAKMLVEYLKKNLRRPGLSMQEEDEGADRFIPVEGLHSDLTKECRDKNLSKFLSGEIWVLVATDVACRGLDFKEIRLVINFDLPTSRENFIHRIGRCGRGNQKGDALVFYTHEDRQYMRVVTSVMKDSSLPIPDEVKDSPKLDMEEFMKHPPLRSPIGHLDGEQGKRFLKKRSIARVKANKSRKVVKDGLWKLRRKLAKT